MLYTLQGSNTDDQPFSKRFTLHQIWQYLNGEPEADKENAETDKESDKEDSQSSN